MTANQRPITGADVLVRGLREHGVRFVFGYPGGPLMPLYDALKREPGIRHILARDEQAAAFMADGYARATGEPGVCLAVCGPGVFNAATPLATSFTDSVPVVLISGQIPFKGRGLRSGYYHENDQLDVCKSFTKWRYCAENAAELSRQVEQAFAVATDRRPGPALLDVPLDVFTEELSEMPSTSPPTALASPRAHTADVRALAEVVDGWRKPVILAGGGSVTAHAESNLAQLALRLGAPVFTTLMGKGAIAADHPLAAGLPWFQATSDLTGMASFMSPLLSEADGMLAVGCRFSQVSTGNWNIPKIPSLVHIDIDRHELGRHYPPQLAIQADARLALRALLAALPQEPRQPWAPATPPRRPWRLPGIDLVGPLRRALPRDGIVVADVTRLAYLMLVDFPAYQPRTFLHPAGFVAMAYGIPAALGARAAFPDRAIVAVVGDGGFMMSGMELATAVQEQLPIVVVLINDNSLSLIRAIQERIYEGRHIGVALRNPDFALFARAFGVRHWQVRDDAAFETALQEALATKETALIEVQVSAG